jgi:hypothetical protein
MLKKFTAKAQRGRMRGNWEDGLELSKIVGDAMRGIKEDALLDVVGWVRGDEIPDINRLASKEFAQLISDYLYYQIEKNKYGSMTNVQLHEQKAFSYQLAEDIKSRMKYVYLDLFSRNITITLTDDGIKVETSTKVTYINPCGEEITYSSNPMFRLDNPYGNAITSKEYDSYKIKLFIHNGDKDALKKYYTENGPRQARKNQTYVIGKKVLIQNREFENTIRMDTEYITRYNTFMQSTGLEYMCQKFRVNAALNDVRTNKDVQYYLKINLFATMGKENNVILDKMIHKDDRIEMVDDIVWAPEGSGYTLVLGHRQYD